MVLFASLAPLNKELIYFCDESSFLESEEKMAVAGLAVPRVHVREVLTRIAAIPPPEGRFRCEEVKWKTTKKWNLTNRKALVDCLTGLIADRLAHFHIRFADFSAYDHDGTKRRIDTVSKMFYQLLLHRAVRHYGTEYRVLIRPDDGACTEELQNFTGAMSVEGQLRYGAHPECVQGVSCANSKREPVLQLLDVTMGALTALKNNRHLLAGASEAKRELSRYALVHQQHSQQLR